MRVTNQEQPFHPIYHYAFVVDAEEGLVLVDVDTLADGEPRNNFLRRTALATAFAKLEQTNAEAARAGAADGRSSLKMSDPTANVAKRNAAAMSHS